MARGTVQRVAPLAIIPRGTHAAYVRRGLDLLTERGGADYIVRVKSYANVLTEYETHPESKSAGSADVNPRQARGLLERRHCEMLSGRFGGWKDPSDERLFLLAVNFDRRVAAEVGQPGFWPVAGFGNLLSLFSKAFDTAVLKSALETASDEDLKAARDELRSILELGSAWTLLEVMMGQYTRRKSQMSPPPPAELPGALLLWITIRNWPRVSQTYRGLIDFFANPQAALTALQQITAQS